MPLLGHEAGIEQDAEVLRDGRPAHLEMSRKRVDGAGGLDEEAPHPAPDARKRLPNRGAKCSRRALNLSAWFLLRRETPRGGLERRLPS
jgi:hypothetical protein